MTLSDIANALPTKAAKATVALASALAAGVFALPAWTLAWIPANPDVAASLAKAILALSILLIGAIVVIALLLRHYLPSSLNLQEAMQAANERLAASRKTP
jgi:fatty acid desaturase